MSELKTLNEWADYSSDRKMVTFSLKTEAIKHIKDLQKQDESDNSSRHKEEWIEHFFNITEEDLK